MHRTIFLDPDIIENLKTISRADPDPELVEAVSEALLTLSPDLRRIICERYFEGLTIGEISERNQLAETEAISRIYEARRRLKMLLAEFVRKRWGITVEGVCRICAHRKKEEIETILRTRRPSESWGSTCRRVERLLKERVQPPQILIAHMKHMK